MKTAFHLLMAGALLAIQAEAAFGQPAPVGALPSGEYDQWSTAGPHHRIVRYVQSATNTFGKVASRESAYTILASGLNYFENGEWIESKELIEPADDGSAVTRHCQYSVRFGAQLKQQGVLTMVTPEGTAIRSHCIGIAYYDAASGKSVLVSDIKESIGEIQPPNRIIYWDAFTDIKGAVMFTCTRSELEADIVLEESPPEPETFGLNSKTARLEVWTEFLAPPNPKIIEQTLRREEDPEKREAMIEPDFLDETMDFGAMHMIEGRAVVVPNTDPDAVFPPIRDQPKIGKRWLESAGRTFLIESAEYLSIQPKLQELRKRASGEASASRQASIGRFIPELIDSEAPTACSVNVATTPKPLHGLAMDYIIKSGVSCDNFTFLSNTTYFIDGTMYIWNSTLIQTNTVVKLIPNNSGYYCLDLYGSVTTPSSSPAAIITSKDDDSVGEVIQGSSSNPVPSGFTKIGLHNINCYFIENLLVRYAQEAIDIGNTSYNAYVFRNSRLEHCFTGVGVTGCQVTFDNIYYCAGSSLYANYGGWVVDHTTPADCGIVATPCFVPGGMGFETSLDVTISTSTGGATIYYTTDGSSPTTNSLVYTAPIHLTQTTMLTAMATRPNWEYSGTAVASYIKAPSLAEGLDAPDFTWTTGGDTYWIGMPNYGYSGNDCVVSKALSDNQSTWFQTQVTGPGRAEFYWKVSSEAFYDMLWFSVDGIDRFGTSGENGWYWNYYDVTGAGLHTLRWTYRKNAIGRSGGDCAYVDYFRFTSNDSDNDGLLDSWEIAYFGNLGQGASGDWDGDGKSNLEEYQAGTDPTVTSTLQVFSPLK